MVETIFGVKMARENRTKRRESAHFGGAGDGGATGFGTGAGGFRDERDALPFGSRLIGFAALEPPFFLPMVWSSVATLEAGGGFGEKKEF
jgi:hypothetical protein